MASEIMVKYGETFKKGKTFHRLDLSIKGTKANGVDTKKAYNDMFTLLQDQLKELKKKVV